MTDTKQPPPINNDDIELTKAAIKPLSAGFKASLKAALERKGTKSSSEAMVKFCGMLDDAIDCYDLYHADSNAPKTQNPWRLVCHITPLVATTATDEWMSYIGKAVDTFSRADPYIANDLAWSRIGKVLDDISVRSDWENGDVIKKMWESEVKSRYRPVAAIGTKRKSEHPIDEAAPPPPKKVKDASSHIETMKWLLKNAVDHINGAAGSTSTFEQIIAERGVCSRCFEPAEHCTCVGMSLVSNPPPLDICSALEVAASVAVAADAVSKPAIETNG